MNQTTQIPPVPERAVVTPIRPDGGAWPPAGEARAGAVRLHAAQGSVTRTLRAIEVLERVIAKDMADPGRGGDPRFRAAPRDIARLVWFLGCSVREAGPAAAAALRATVSISGWVAEMQAIQLPSRVVPVIELGRAEWIEPGDRLLAFACETAAVALQELRFDLSALSPGLRSEAA